jgi:hypothetical protein
MWSVTADYFKDSVYCLDNIVILDGYEDVLNCFNDVLL